MASLWYRPRWQVELSFKRFKVLAQLGHLPEYNEESAKAWLHGKLLAEKAIRYALTIPPRDTIWRQRRPHSPWRDFGFALIQVRHSIEPALSLEQMIEEWNEISESLAESPRMRSNQVDACFSAMIFG